MSDATPRVSIVIPTHNNAGFIGQALESIRAQSYDSREVIVVDDGSNDDTERALSPYRDSIVYLRQESSGPSKARNRGLEYATGQFVVFLDSDDLMLSDSLAGQVDLFRAHPSTDVVHGGWCLVDSAGQWLSTSRPWHEAPRLDLKACLLQPCFRLCAIMFRRAVLDKVGGFDVSLRQAEDVDLVLRVMLNGARARWLKQPVFSYRQHEASLTRRSLERVTYVNRVYAEFFAHPGLPQEISELESHVRYHVSMWSVWRLYRSGFGTEIPRFLRQARNFMEGSEEDIVRQWVDQLANKSCTEGAGGKSDVIREFWPHFRAALG